MELSSLSQRLHRNKRQATPKIAVLIRIVSEADSARNSIRFFWELPSYWKRRTDDWQIWNDSSNGDPLDTAHDALFYVCVERQRAVGLQQR